MKYSIELEVDIDLVEIVRNSESWEEASTMLNYRLEKSRKKVEKDLQVKFDKVKSEFEDKLNQICDDEFENSLR